MNLLLDLYKFCESYDRYTRQHIAKFIYTHKDAPRMARHAGYDLRKFASAASKEFCARMATEGYLNNEGGILSSNGKRKRPISFDFVCVDGDRNRYTYEMMNLDKVSDEELFGNKRNIDRSERRIL